MCRSVPHRPVVMHLDEDVASTERRNRTIDQFHADTGGRLDECAHAMPDDWRIGRNIPTREARRGRRTATPSPEDGSRKKKKRFRDEFSGDRAATHPGRVAGIFRRSRDAWERCALRRTSHAPVRAPRMTVRRAPAMFTRKSLCNAVCSVMRHLARTTGIRRRGRDARGASFDECVSLM